MTLKNALRAALLVGVVLCLGAPMTGCASSRAEGYARLGYDFTSLSRVAVVHVTGDVHGEPAKNQITDFFNQQLLRRGYSPIERQQIREVLAEQDFQASDVTGAEGAARIGRILNVDAAVMVNIPRFDERMNMSARMVDVETGEVIWSASGSGRTGRNLNRAVGALVGAAAGAGVGAGVSDDTGVTIVGGAAGAAGGGLIGAALTPQKERQAQRVIEKLAESLPQARR